MPIRRTAGAVGSRLHLSQCIPVLGSLVRSRLILGVSGGSAFGGRAPEVSGSSDLPQRTLDILPEQM